MIDINRYYNTYQVPNFEGYTDYALMMASCFCKKSYLRVLNAIDEAVDVQINDILMAENLRIGEFTKYVKFPPGTYHILIHGRQGGKALFETEIDLDYNLVYTGVIGADKEADDICILMVPEEKPYNMTGNLSGLRLANLCLDGPSLVLEAAGGPVLFSDIGYCKVSCNIGLPSGRYTMNLKRPDGTNILEYRMDLAPKMHYTMFLVGSYKEGSIKIIVPEDGVNYLDLC